MLLTMEDFKQQRFKTGMIVGYYTPFNIWGPLTWLPALIRLFKKNKYDHVGVVIRNWDMPFINEPARGGLKAYPAKQRLKGKKVIIGKFDTKMGERQIAMKANSQLGVTGHSRPGYIAWLYDMHFWKYGKESVMDIRRHSNFILIFFGIIKEVTFLEEQVNQ